MEARTNELGQPIGAPLPDWKPCPRPPRTPMEGRYCRLEPINASRHGEDLFEAFDADTENRMWTYLSVGPFSTRAALDEFLKKSAESEDPLFFAILDRVTGKAMGFGSYLRIDSAVGVIEVGFLTYSPSLQRTPVSTEAMYLMMKRAFDELGYRRYEWKCDSLNAPSRRAAERLGFIFEGVFRQVTIYKGRNRDTAWFSILGSEWPAQKRAFEAWLDPSNFSEPGEQLRSLGSFTEDSM